MNLSSRLISEVEKSLYGKPDVVRLAVACLWAEGHLLIDDIPGVGKTTLALGLSNSLGLKFQRIQFTSDLLPSDVLGVSVFNPKSQTFDFKPGPLFTNIVLADEINRASPKTQSALMECMQEGQVSVDNLTHTLPKPFFVIATQNPHEQHGTFPLPESQLDRFMMRLSLGYPSSETELSILRQTSIPNTKANSLEIKCSDVMAQIESTRNVKVDPSLDQYIVSIAQLTRASNFVELGLSPRGSLALRRSAQALAWTFDRNYVIPDDIKQVAVPVMAHRLKVKGGNFNGRTSLAQEMLVRELVDQIAVPV